LNPTELPPSLHNNLPESYQENIARLRSDLINSLLLTSAFLGLPAVLASLLRIQAVGWNTTLYLHVGIYPFILVTALLRKRLSVNVRASILAISAYLIGVIGLYAWGLLGSGSLFLVITCLLTMLLFGRKTGIVAILVSVAAMLLIGLGASNGHIQYEYNLQQYAVTPIAWITATSILLLITSLVSISITKLFESQQSFVSKLDKRTSDLQEANQRLRQEISERQRAEETLQRQNMYLAALQEMNLGLISRLDVDNLLENIVQRAGQLLGTSHGFLDLVEPGTNELEPKIAIGALKDSLKYKVIPGEGLAGKVWQSCQPVLVADYDSWSGRILEFSPNKVRSVIGVPLLSRERVIGVLGLAHDYQTQQEFTQEDIEILGQFAQLAAIALDNAWLFTKTHETLQREQHLKQVARILSSTNELSETILRFLPLAAELVGAQAAVLGVVSADGQAIETLYLHNLPKESTPNPAPKGKGLAWKIIQSGQPLILDDYSAHPEAIPQWAAASPGGFLGLPIIAGQEKIGVLGLFSQQPKKHFSNDHLSLAQTVGGQAALAIQNARRFENERARGQRQATLFRLSAKLAAILDEDQVWQQVAEGLFDASLGYTHIITLEWDPDCNERIIRGCVGWAEKFDCRHISAGQGLSERPLLDGQPHYSPDVTLEQGYIPGLETGSEADIPIRVEDDLVGVLVIERAKPYAFSQEDLNVFTAAANQAGLALGRARLLHSTRQQLAEIELLQAQLREQAIRDALTGLFNRRYMQETLPRELARARRDNSPLSIMIMDLDHFKRVNDTHGHRAGDHLLQALAELLKRHTRAGDIVCRYGGEEFVIIMPGAELSNCQQRGEQLRADVAALHVRYSGKDLNVTISIGIAAYPLHGKSGEEILIMADRALYQAKQLGRNRIVVYSDFEENPAFLD
jgi:diguanylate cyclase (GGDEF)-like protein